MKKTGIGLIAFLLLIQLYRIDKTNPESAPEKDFMTVVDVPKNIKPIIINGCYDCHSNQTVYPWYSNITPINWWLKDHVDDGKKHLNFSVWGDYELKKKDHKLEEVIEMLEEGEMPLKPYTIIHAEAKFTENQKQQLINWVVELSKAL